MRSAYAVHDVRAAEQSVLAGLPEGALMQRAAAGLARVCVLLLGTVYGSRVLLLVGSGDNGGDALFAGARLADRGARVDALLLGDRAHEAGLAALKRAGGRVIDDVPSPRLLSALQADLVVDGIVGIGGKGALRGRAADVVAGLGDGPMVVAVDVPSGVDADTGEVAGAAVHADVTVTFGALKPGLLVDPGAGYAGAVDLVDIGLGPHLPDDATVEVLQAADVHALLPSAGAGRESDKYRRGVVGVSAGSEHYTGAAVLCVGGAVRGGAGMVRYVGDDAPTALVRRRWPEVVVGEGRVQAWTVGSGGGEGAAERLATALKDDVPVVVDADALSAFADQARSGATALLTPHAGELARRLGVDREAVEARRLEHARRAAVELDAVVLLKGSTTVVATPDGRLRVNPTGTAALATAGTGDVLAGLCGALLAGGLDPLDAGSVGAWLHGLAGRLAADGGAPISAYDVLDALPAAFRTLGN
jgi:ADP-dependent NAD(P)H-hydrate dehydratase / NAD(P)H-hydrate epimerase